MQKTQWIVNGKSHHGVIASTGGYINLVVTKRDYTVQLVGNQGEEEIVYTSTAKNQHDAKRLAVAFGHSLLKDAGCLRAHRKSTPRKRLGFRKKLASA